MASVSSHLLKMTLLEQNLINNININWEELWKLCHYKTGCYKAEFNALCPSNSSICIFRHLKVLVNYDISEIASKQQTKETGYIGPLCKVVQ